MSKPQVSVVMSAYNAERYVAEAVESILSQTFHDLEFLVFDDGSTDRSLEILQTYPDRDDRIRVFAKPHCGKVPWLNEGIRIARGEFIARMDADDVALENRLAQQVKYMNEHQRCVALGCNLILIDSDGEALGVLRQETEPKVIEEMLLKGVQGVIVHPTSLMRRETLLSIGGYRQEYDTMEDFDLWLRLAELGQLTNLREVLFKYRLNPSSVCSTQFRTQERYADAIITEARLRRGLKPLERSARSSIHASNDNVARLQLEAILIAGVGNRRVALRRALLALYKEPLSLSSWKTVCWILLPRCIKARIKRILLAL